MSKYSDPLGIEQKIQETEQLHELTPLTEDMADDWNNHPVTKRLKQALQIELYKRQSEWMSTPNPELYIAMQQIIDYPVIQDGEA